MQTMFSRRHSARKSKRAPMYKPLERSIPVTILSSSSFILLYDARVRQSASELWRSVPFLKKHFAYQVSKYRFVMFTRCKFRRSRHPGGTLDFVALQDRESWVRLSSSHSLQYFERRASRKESPTRCLTLSQAIRWLVTSIFDLCDKSCL